MFSGKRQPYLPAYNPESLVSGQVLVETPSDFLTRYARALASITITISGTLATNDQLRVSVNLPALPGGSLVKTVVLASGDTATAAAQKIAKALNDDALLRAYGCYANSLAGVVTFYWPGPLGNNVSLTQSVPVGVGVISLGNSGKMAGGSGPVIPVQMFNFGVEGQSLHFQAGIPKLVGDNVVAAMAKASSPII